MPFFPGTCNLYLPRVVRLTL